MESGIKLMTSFSFKGFEYVLKSGMLYTGDGFGGHWRTLVRKKDGSLLIFDDAKEPYEGTLIDLELCTDLIFCKQMYHCFVCSKSFTHKHYLRRHILNSHEGSSCENCGEVFANDEQYCSHFKKIHLTEDLTCVICSEKFERVDLVDIVQFPLTNTRPWGICVRQRGPNKSYY